MRSLTILSVLLLSVSALPSYSSRKLGDSVEVDPEAECPQERYLPGATQIGSSAPVEIRWLAKGSDGCVYDIVNGWNGLPAIAKVRYRYEEYDFGDELQALTLIHQLYNLSRDEVGRQWVVMAKISGQSVFETQKWKQVVGTKWYLENDASPQQIEACVKMTEEIERSVRADVQHYVTQFGVLHKDVHYGNIHFSEDLSKASLYDWGVWERHDGPLTVAELGQVFVNQLPPFDVEITSQHGISHRAIQGVCQSERRLNGETPESSLPWSMVASHE
ncbi:hypothetical protein FRB99_007500 [Tulasnella sp. 403]|nr:hypothetical protein FRB99_007500 [Tulasnella sp. 403]